MDIPVQIILKLVNMLSGEAKKVTDDLKSVGDAAKKIGADAKGIADPLKEAGDEAKKLGDKMKGVTGHAKSLKGAFDKMGQGIGQITRGVGMMAAKFAIMKGAAYAIGGAFLTAGIGRETFEAQMRGFGLSKGEARDLRESMFNLDMDKVYGSEKDFQESFVLGLQRGIKLSNEQLSIINDMAAASRMSVVEVTNMVLAGSAGMARGLKQFGIEYEKVSTGKGKNKKEQSVLSWNGPDGKRRTVSVKEGDQRRLLQTIFKALQERSAGADAEYGNTIPGILDQYQDAWAYFVKSVNDAGIFDEIKRQMKMFGDFLDEKRKDGTLDKWAKETSDALIEILRAGVDFAKAVPAMAEGFKALVSPLKNLKASTIVMLAFGLWMLPDLIAIGAGLVTLAQGFMLLKTALGVGAAGAAGGAAGAGIGGTLLGIAGGIAAIAGALMLLDNYKDTFREFLQSMTGEPIAKANENLIIPAQYGEMSGEATRKALAKTFPFMQTYYDTVDALFGRAPEPKDGEMGPTRPDPTKTWGGVLKRLHDWSSPQLKTMDRLPAEITGQSGVQMPVKPDIGYQGYGIFNVPKAATEGQEAIKALKKINEEADTVWRGSFTEKKEAEVETNAPVVKSVLEQLRDLWRADWGQKTLRFAPVTPPAMPSAPFGGGGIMPPRPPSASGTMTDKIGYTPQLRPPSAAAPAPSPSVNAPINVTINAKGVDEAAFNRYAQKAAQSVKNSLRGVLNDGGVPQAV